MKSLRVLAFVVSISLLGLMSFAQQPSQTQPSAEQPSPIIRGTINVVLGNSHGMVVVTDSAQTITDENGQRLAVTEGQKLIKLDDRTVCAIAGFGGAGVPTAPQFNVDVIGIIAELRDQLAGQQAQPFEIKLRMLSSMMEFYLSSIANLREVLTPSPIATNPYTFSLFKVGYDSDGSPKIGVLQLVGALRPRPDGTRTWDIAEGIAMFRVGPQLAPPPLLAGMWDAAQQVVSHPEQFADPAVERYAKSMTTDQGASLTLAELEAFANFLADESARKHSPEVGGHKQICIFTNGRIERLEQPTFPDPPRPFNFNLFVNVRSQGHFIEASPGVKLLWVRCALANETGLRLADNYFVGSEIRDSVVIYDGGAVLLDKTNRVTNSRLVLGPHADPKSSAVRDLVAAFQWTNQSDLSK